MLVTFLFNGWTGAISATLSDIRLLVIAFDSTVTVSLELIALVETLFRSSTIDLAFSGLF